MAGKSKREAPFPLGGISQRGANVVFGQLRIIGTNVSVRHARGKPAKYVGDRNPEPADAGPAESFLLGFTDIRLYNRKGLNRVKFYGK